MTTPTRSQFGLAEAIGANILWGIVPIYFKLLASIGSLEIVAHRILWSVPLLLVILWIRGNLHGLTAAWRDRRTRNFLLMSSLFIAANWLIYIFAVLNGQVLAASLGYFLNPLLAVVLATLVLGEKMNRTQWIAVAIAGLGVSILALQAWQTLWISLALAGAWGIYSLIRKVADAGPMAGLTIETMLLAPLCLIYLIWVGLAGTGYGFGGDTRLDLLLIGSAAVTALPLLLFNSAVKKTSFIAIGLVGYLAPTIQFFVGWLLYGETLTPSHVVCFVLIWISLAIYTGDAIGKERRRRAAVPI